MSVTSKRKIVALNKSSTEVFTAYEYYVDTGNICENIDGWDNTQVEVVTQPKLHAPGSYEVSNKINERNVEITFFDNESADITSIRRALQSIQLSFENITLERVFMDETGDETRKEILEGKITSVSYDRFKEQAHVTFNVKCLNPLKTVYLNGSETAETEGEL